MDYKNDNRTPRDRVTGEFLSELLFTESDGDCKCNYASANQTAATVKRTDRQSQYGAGNFDVRNAVANRNRQRSCRNTDYAVTEDCVTKSENYSLVMAYVPMQKFGNLFDLDEGFCEGTIFKDLRFPFYPTPCRKECN